jgi:hypothetical protein
LGRPDETLSGARRESDPFGPVPVFRQPPAPPFGNYATNE